MTGPMQPYYIIMRLPGEPHEEYILMLPMVPKGRDNMIAWMAARCDGTDYGHLFEYAFSKDSLFYGPYQIQARINQSPEISRQLSLWNQMGSKVILGNLIVIPVQDSLLYVEPLYIRAENGQLPELQRVIASYGDQVVMGETLPATLASLFTGREGVARSGGRGDQTAGADASGDAVRRLRCKLHRPHRRPNHYNRALKALSAGNWTEFGTEMQQLGQDLGQNPAGAHALGFRWWKVPSDRIRVLIADDHRMFRDLLGPRSPRNVKSSARLRTVKPPSRLALRTKPHVILLDVMMPGIGGLSAAHELARKVPGAKVLVLSQYSDEEYVLEALGEAGVAGYILKTDGAAEILPAIRAVHAGLRYLSPSIAPIVLHEMNRPPSERTAGRTASPSANARCCA